MPDPSSFFSSPSQGVLGLQPSTISQQLCLPPLDTSHPVSTETRIRLCGSKGQRGPLQCMCQFLWKVTQTTCICAQCVSCFKTRRPLGRQPCSNAGVTTQRADNALLDPNPPANSILSIYDSVAMQNIREASCAVKSAEHPAMDS